MTARLWEVQPSDLENPEAVDAIWPHLKRVEKFTKGEWSVAHILSSVGKRELSLFSVIEGPAIVAVVGVEMVKFPNLEQMANIHFLVGKNRKNWMHLLPQIEARMAEQGCNFTQAGVRTGLLGDMQSQGYKIVRYVVQKDMEQ